MIWNEKREVSLNVVFIEATKYNLQNQVEETTYYTFPNILQILAYNIRSKYKYVLLAYLYILIQAKHRLLTIWNRRIKCDCTVLFMPQCPYNLQIKYKIQIQIQIY